MKKNALSIAIIDDEDAYFNKKMIQSAEKAGFNGIMRFKFVDLKLYNRLLAEPFDILILDVKGSVDPTIATDGLALAKNLKEHTNSYIAITSAHQFHLSNQAACADYVIEQRTLTNVDFINELKFIVLKYLSGNLRIYKKVLYRFGFTLAKASLGKIGP